jgi:hypothetical protein
MKNLYLLLFVCLMLSVQASAQETETEVAALTASAAGPVNCGAVTPEGREIVYTGEKIPVSAVPEAGYSFSGWMISGDGVISSETSASATLVLNGNAVLKGCFYKNDGSMKRALNINPSDAAYGSVVPDGQSSVDAGRIFDISAVPDNGFRFIRWLISGVGEIENILSPDTRAVIYDDTEITAVFAPEDDVYDITLYAAGESSAPEHIFVIKGDSVSLRAVHTPQTFFIRWTSSDGGRFTRAESADTVFTPENSCSVTALTAPAICNFSNKSRKIKVKIKGKPEKGTPSAGDISFRMLPMCLGPDDFNPNTDKITVYINGRPFEVSSTAGTFRRTPTGYKYKSDDKPKIKLILDFISAVWTFSVKKTELQFLDLSGGCDAMLEVNGSSYGHKYIPDEKISLSFSASRNQAEVVSGYPLLAPVRLSIKKDTGKNNRDSIKVVLNQIPLSYTFNPAADSLTLSAGGYVISVPPGMMSEKNGTFSYKDRQYSIKFNPAAQTLNLSAKKINIALPGFDEKLKFTLTVGKNRAAALLTPAFSQKISFKYDSFYWKPKKE